MKPNKKDPWTYVVHSIQAVLIVLPLILLSTAAFRGVLKLKDEVSHLQSEVAILYKDTVRLIESVTARQDEELDELKARVIELENQLESRQEPKATEDAPPQDFIQREYQRYLQQMLEQ